ncbi:MAG: SpoIIE family protein phosphatase [Oscillospiraceae bacterium]|jgi:stage II sporulation protein E|nr:SpoIIE family protein phosphatase [Oscillospiraceae bacterium]
MKESQVLPKKGLSVADALEKLHGIRQYLLLFGGGFILAGAQIAQQSLPLAACLVAALPFGMQSVAAALGALVGYLTFSGGVISVEFIALSFLMLAAIAVFQGTQLPAKRYFMPAMMMGVCAVLGAIYILGGNPSAANLSIWAMKILLSGVSVFAFRAALSGSRRAKLYLAAALISGAAGITLYINVGLLCAGAIMVASPELALIAVAGFALDLTGNFANCASIALLLPSVLSRTLHLRSKVQRAALCAAVSLAVLLFFGQASVGAVLSVVVGASAGILLQQRNLLSAGVNASPQEIAAQHLGDAAMVLESLQRMLPEEEIPASQSEADCIYDGAADRVCRCCPRFHRCWEHEAAATYSALTGAARMIIERGAALAEDFPQSFRDTCCHMEGFLTAINQEMEGMLYRRRYRVQMSECRQVVSQQFGYMAGFLRDMQAESAQMERLETAYVPRIGVSTAGKNGNRIVGDHGACFMGRGSNYYVLLCDGMGTGKAAATLSGETIRMLSMLLKSGIDSEAALRVINGAFILRGTGCFATVDLLHVDLNTGEAELLKWGAAPSYLRMDSDVKRIGTALPPPGVGVGGDHAPESYRLSLGRGELLVLVSDGVEGEYTETTVEAFTGDSPRELAAVLIASAGADDDMTAVAISLQARAS